MTIFVAGFPHAAGGASGEALGVTAILRQHGVDVAWIPTWGQPKPDGLPQLERLGCQVYPGNRRRLAEIPGLPGSWVLMFCNEVAAAAWKEFKAIGCKLCGLPCMTYWLSYYRKAEWDAVVCQSEVQKAALKADAAHVIPGYYEWHLVPFKPRPHAPDEPFVVGRLARNDAAKWHPDLPLIYQGIPNARGFIMGVPESMKNEYRRKADGFFMTMLPERKMPAEEFYSQLHAYVTANDFRKGGTHARENWPRVGLEAMSRGIPIVAEDNGGWPEMVAHGETGFIYKTETEATKYASLLASDEPLRLRMASAARQRLETQICEPEAIWAKWAGVLGLQTVDKSEGLLDAQIPS